MRALIENYRGFNIYYETYNENFEVDISVDSQEGIRIRSYSEATKYIDEFLKTNNDFIKIKICKFPSYFHDYAEAVIIGLRKDNRLAIERDDGKKELLSDYDEKEWFIKYDENSSIIEKLEALKVRDISKRV